MASSLQNPAPHPDASRRSVTDWTVRIRANAHELNGSFSVLIFLDAVPDDPHLWKSSPSYVGRYSAYVSSTPDQQPAVTEGFVHLSNWIAQKTSLGSFDPGVVVPFLKDKLSWRVQMVSPILTKVTSLEVTVLATPLTLEPGAVFPTPGETQFYPSITAGRVGGSRPERASEE
ncbi:hypothetical protein IW261DRAFT_1331325 [Armillaria novae-zelandiae]|uniref:Tyrosinase C-terminal domain-containing protein n=1 Tax=Armillaria novae-zelandiae TaxID=153914 RepID=A0AA39PKH0_9AGAR|nr:hypothetical protein IW261DRAFT_1331325 [Armillaria novae-zelandiae]